MKKYIQKSMGSEEICSLREITSRTLEDMQTNAIEVEENTSSSATLKAKEDKAQRKLKSSEEASNSSKTKTEDSKINEITSLLRNMSNRISKIETQSRTVQQMVTRPQNQNHCQYKRNPPLQILQRPSNDQQVPTPLLIDDQQPDDNTMTLIECWVMLYSFHD